MPLRWHAALLLILPLCVTAGERLYKWVDENGKIQYSDKPPQQQTEKGTTILNKQGVPLKKTDGYLNAEQRIAREAELAKRRAEAQKAEDARRRDKALMSSFNKTSEIDAIRDRNIEQLNAGIQSDNIRSEVVRKRLDGLEKREASMLKANKPVPDNLQNDIKSAKDELGKIAAHIEQQKKDIETTRQRAEADKKRLIELRGESVRDK
ncbi:DUF4124 domain-containing protein [Chitinimonas sp. BJYL2]|uniref:DUF4124 domain-containing protein n=1 Tax=Chitinimonas sp. BJYL2 TaxID=2976696 RepID=UPI0022B4EC92|nr:DUF4124 domain-containing protein [Chitinimonas sp. BJYL2]